MQKVICIVGPTSSGKTSLAIDIAKEVGGEVISADSRQVYRGLNLASGKATEDEMNGVPHHLLDVADPKDVFSASDFVEEGRTILAQLEARSVPAIVAGGTGFYIDALVGRISLAEVEPNPQLRARLETKNIEELQHILEGMDPERYATIDIHNPRRLIRSIEIAEALGKNPTPNETLLYDVLWIGIDVPFEELKEKIKQRLLERIDQGMVDEIASLKLTPERLEQLGLECRFVGRHLHQGLSHDDMLIQLEKEIVRYAKRQLTWFKKNTHIHWFNPKQHGNAIETAVQFIQT